MAEHTFKVNIEWSGGRNAVGHLATTQFQTAISIPKEMDGPNVGTNPDEMLLGAAATCYMITVAAMLERSQIEAAFDLVSEGIVDVANGIFTYKEIHHYITIELQDASERNLHLAERYAYKAEDTCMISKAIKGNVKVQVHLTLS
ncbi:MAG: SACOL1771 family peroxiredoxin [Solibacillus sp.]